MWNNKKSNEIEKEFPNLDDFEQFSALDCWAFRQGQEKSKSDIPRRGLGTDVDPRAPKNETPTSSRDTQTKTTVNKTKKVKTSPEVVAEENGEENSPEERVYKRMQAMFIAREAASKSAAATFFQNTSDEETRMWGKYMWCAFYDQTDSARSARNDFPPNLHPGDSTVTKRQWEKGLRAYRLALQAELQNGFEKWATPPAYLTYDHEAAQSGRPGVEVEFLRPGSLELAVAGPPGLGPPGLVAPSPELVAQLQREES